MTATVMVRFHHFTRIDHSTMAPFNKYTRMHHSTRAAWHHSTIAPGYTNSIFTLSISSASQAGFKPWYLEQVGCKFQIDATHYGTSRSKMEEMRMHFCGLTGSVRLSGTDFS